MYQDGPTILQVFAEPRVIDQNMLVSLIIDQGPKGEAGRLFYEDGIKLNEVNEIRIEFLNILRIDNLWTMTNLVKLKLSNNVIEKIENLDALVHLRELDLSFNSIRVMENLNHLTKLEILLLYKNEIQTVEAIDGLHELAIFSIGSNAIADWDHVLYLRKFRNLRSLNTTGNPCWEKSGYLDYVLAFLPQLVYYDYKMITNEERRVAVEQHYRALSNLEETEARETEEQTAQDEYKKKLEFQATAYIEYLDDDYIFEQMFANDKEGKGLTQINEDTQHAFQEYKKSFYALCLEFYEFGLREHQKRISEVKLFNDAVNSGKESAENQGRAITDAVIEKKKEIFADVKRLLKAMSGDVDTAAVEETTQKALKLSEEFSSVLSSAWTQLMSNEVALHEQLEDVNEVFKFNISDMVESFVVSAQGYFSQLRNREAEYNDTINGIVLYYLSGFGDDAKIPAHLVNLCGDKDILNNSLALSHDSHLQVIDARESSTLSRLKNWLEEYIEQLTRGETERNRQQVLEISHFVDSQQEEFNSLQLLQQISLNTGDPEIILALES